jgi:hypothetical protein
MTEILTALMIWIGALTGYQVNTGPPQVTFLSSPQVARVCADGALSPGPAQACYKFHEHTIFMPRGFSFHHPGKVGVLVHELTHVLQFSNGHVYTPTTMPYLEAEADRIEMIYEGSGAVQAELERMAAGGAGGYASYDGRPGAVVAPSAAPREVVSAKPTPRPTSQRYGVHLESYRSPNNARRAATRLQARFRGLLRDKQMRVVRTDLGAKGVYYRVVAAPFSNRDAARRLAGSFKARVSYAAVVDLPY